MEIDVTDEKRRAPGRVRLMQIAVLLPALVILAGCSTSTIDENRLAPRDTGSLIWPNPPEAARISYLSTVRKAKDVGADTGFLAKLAYYVLGKKKDDGIYKPYGVTADSAGRIIVADTALKRVHVFDPRKKKYFYIDEAGDSEFSSPIAVAIGADDEMYVTDSILGKVFVFDRDGDFKYGFAAGRRPTGIAVDRTRKLIYVSDTVAQNVKVYDLKGGLLRTIGRRGTGPGEFNYPVDLFVDRNGELYVIDSMNYRVEMFDDTGKFVAKFGKQGDGTGNFGRPKGVAVDRDGHIYVADALFDTVQIFDREGRFLLNFGSIGTEAGMFWMPCGLFIDSGDNIYVSDSYNGRVQVFEYLGNG